MKPLKIANCKSDDHILYHHNFYFFTNRKIEIFLERFEILEEEKLTIDFWFQQFLKSKRAIISDSPLYLLTH